ncbi:MAG: hypothetical protein ACLTYN_15195 [Dysosmobacter welbionis]
MADFYGFGTANPASFGLWGRQGEVPGGGSTATPPEDGRRPTQSSGTCGSWRRAGDGVIVDPSAASSSRRCGGGFRVVERLTRADGIRVTADLLKRRRIVIAARADCLREMKRTAGTTRAADAPKEQDHAMDVCGTSPWIWRRKAEWLCATWVERRA